MFRNRVSGLNFRPSAMHARPGKIILHTINIISCMFSVVLLVTGIMVVANSQRIDWINSVVGAQYSNIHILNTIAVVMIIAPILQFLICFVGTYSTYKEIARGHQLYVMMVLCILLPLQAITGGLNIGFLREVNEVLEQTMRENLQEFYGKPDWNQTTAAWDTLQTEFGCCGSSSFKDYQESYYLNATRHHTNAASNVSLSNATGNLIPESCCIQEDYSECLNSIQNNSMEEGVYFLQGCHSKFKEWIGDKCRFAVITSLTPFSIQFMSIITVCYITRHVLTWRDWVVGTSF